MYVATGVYRVTVVVRGHISKTVRLHQRILVGMLNMFFNREHVHFTRDSLTDIT
jgi:hypothetical protein